VSLLSDFQKLREDYKELQRQLEETAAATKRHEEQISGKRGLIVALEALAEEMRGVKRALYTAGGGFVLVSFTFAIGVIKLTGNG
jgi:chromosome segregation ATPase